MTRPDQADLQRPCRWPGRGFWGAGISLSCRAGGALELSVCGKGYRARAPCRHDSSVSALPLLCHSGCSRLIMKVQGDGLQMPTNGPGVTQGPSESVLSQLQIANGDILPGEGKPGGAGPRPE